MKYIDKVKLEYEQPIDHSVDRQANIDMYSMKRKGVAYLTIKQYPVHAYGTIYYMCKRYSVKYTINVAEAKEMNIVDACHLHQYSKDDETTRFFCQEKLKKSATQDYNSYNGGIKVLMLDKPSGNLPQIILNCCNPAIVQECNRLYRRFRLLCNRHLTYFKQNNNIKLIDEIIREWNLLVESVL